MKIIIEIDEKKLQESVRKEFGEEVLPIDIYLMQRRIYNIDQLLIFSKTIYRFAAKCWGLVRNPDAYSKKEHIQ